MGRPAPLPGVPLISLVPAPYSTPLSAKIAVQTFEGGLMTRVAYLFPWLTLNDSLGLLYRAFDLLGHRYFSLFDASTRSLLGTWLGRVRLRLWVAVFFVVVLVLVLVLVVVGGALRPVEPRYCDSFSTLFRTSIWS